MFADVFEMKMVFRAMSYMLGTIIIFLAVFFMFTDFHIYQTLNWVREMLGYSFLILTMTLSLIAIYCWLKISSEKQSEHKFWMAIGLHSANGIMTLALTYTLLGISLGIGSLSGKSLSPETVQIAVQEMTTNFSLAFMTTVIGLPLSTILKAFLIITHNKR
ncbi:MAG: hypothetical protein CMM44_03355 [Rhodospirillaceae bacterium]|nr:hypothetical protein [Rhodospirillaceae bacterium]